MTNDQLQTIWYVIGILVTSITLLTITVNHIKKRIHKKRAAKTYSRKDKLHYYRNRSKNKKLSYSQRQYAKDKLKSYLS
jgi:hypothetical protein